MTDKEYLCCVSEVEFYSDRDAYISDLALSTMWDDPEDADIPAERLEALGEIWDAYHRNVKEIAAAAGLSCRKLAERFCIPYRTMEEWSAGRRESPVYVRMMMQECLGLIHR